MELDAIVFSQEELEKALADGARRILLCDGDFFLEQPPADAEFSVLGSAAVYSGGAALSLSASPGEYRRASSLSGTSGGRFTGSGGAYGSGGRFAGSGGAYGSGGRFAGSGGSYRFGSYRPGSSGRRGGRRFSGPYSEGLEELFLQLELEGIGGYGIHLI